MSYQKDSKVYLNNISFTIQKERIKGGWNKIIFQLQLYPTVFNKKDEEVWSLISKTPEFTLQST